MWLRNKVINSGSPHFSSFPARFRSSSMSRASAVKLERDLTQQSKKQSRGLCVAAREGYKDPSARAHRPFWFGW